MNITFPNLMKPVNKLIKALEKNRTLYLFSHRMNSIQ